MSIQGENTENIRFTIIPLMISDLSGNDQSRSKQILIKIGNKEGQPLKVKEKLQMDLFLQGFEFDEGVENRKGIIKIYEVASNGNRKICCVGPITSKQIIGEDNKMQNVRRKLVKKIGHLSIQLQVKWQLLGKNQGEKSHQKNKQEIKMQKTSRETIKLESEYESNEKQSHENIMILKQLETLGQVLVEQRRKNSQLQEKIDKANEKMRKYKSLSESYKQEIKQYLKQFELLIASCERQRNKYLISVDDSTREIKIKFKKGVEIERIFSAFLHFLTQKVAHKYTHIHQMDKIGQNKSQLKIMRQLESQLAKKNQIIQSLESERMKEMKVKEFLVKQLGEKEKKISEQSEQIHKQRKTIKDQLEQIRQIRQNYLKVKSVLQSSDSTTDQSSKANSKFSVFLQILEQSNDNIQKIEEQNKQLKSTISNMECVIEQMREEYAQMNELLQKYQEMYGEMKNLKDKELELKLKECIQWIQMQNKGYYDHDFSAISKESERGLVSSLKRSVDKLQDLSLAEIERIKREIEEFLIAMNQVAKAKGDQIQLKQNSHIR